jgi:hypothetical protein
VLVSIIGLLTIVIGKLNGVHRDMNSRFDQWMETVKNASYAEGVKSEQDRKKDESQTRRKSQ